MVTWCPQRAILESNHCSSALVNSRAFRIRLLVTNFGRRAVCCICYCYSHITLDINDASDWSNWANASFSLAKRMLSIIVMMCGRNPILSTNVTLWELHMSLVWWEQSRQLCSAWDLDCVRAEIISNKYAQNTRHVAPPLTNFLPLRVGILTRWTEQKKLKFLQSRQTLVKA